MPLKSLRRQRVVLAHLRELIPPSYVSYRSLGRKTRLPPFTTVPRYVKLEGGNDKHRPRTVVSLLPSLLTECRGVIARKAPQLVAELYTCSRNPRKDRLPKFRNAFLKTVGATFPALRTGQGALPTVTSRERGRDGHRPTTREVVYIFTD